MEKIQELTEKLYREGVEKGEAEAARLVEEAREEAGKLLAGAREEADKLLAEARKKAKETEDNTRSELKLAAGQALEALKSEVADMISDFMGRFVVAMAGNWAAEGGMTVSTPEADALTTYVRENAKKLLAGGLKIEKVAGRRASFSIAPADGSYRVDFGPEEFAAYFKEFLRPQLVEMLFEPRP